VIAIAGNRGKTVVKRVLTGLLEAAQERVRANPRSYNTEVGLPLAVLGLEIDPRRWTQVVQTLAAASWKALVADRGGRAPRLLVLELGARHPGDMAELLRTVRPDWAIVTPLGTEGEPETLDCLRGEMETLAQGVMARGGPSRLLVAGDDARLEAIAGQAGATLNRGALVRTAGGFLIQEAAHPYVLGPDIVGESGEFAVLAAVALGERLGLDAACIQTYLTRLTGPAELSVAAGTRRPVAGGMPAAASRGA
jgi:hypothetical protein